MKKPENKVKKRVKEICDSLDIFNRAYVATPMTKGGFPDRLCCVNGIFVTIECKTKGNKPTPLQSDCMEQIRKSHGITLVVDETNIDQLHGVLSYMKYMFSGTYVENMRAYIRNSTSLSWELSTPKFEI